jgi:hypothetical protein
VDHDTAENRPMKNLIRKSTDDKRERNVFQQEFSYQLKLKKQTKVSEQSKLIF